MSMNSSLSNSITLRFEKLAPPVLIGLLPLGLYWRLIFSGEVLYWGLPLYQFYPWHRLTVEAIQSGHLPLWTDLLGNGAPLLANHQSALFYPLNLIYFVMPVERAMGYSVVLHLILAGLFAYAWGQTIGLSRFGATVTGLSFMLSAFFVSRTQFITIVNGAAWLPLLFLLAERLVHRRTVPDAVWLGVALALQFLAGHAQVWFYSLWAVGFFALARAWSAHRKQREGRDSGVSRTYSQYGRIFALLSGGLVLALGLSAIQLLPTAELALNSQRASGLDINEAMTYSFWPWRLLTLVTPGMFGSPATGDYWGYAAYWEDAGYVGVLPLLLALSLVLSMAQGAVWKWMRPKHSPLNHALSLLPIRRRVFAESKRTELKQSFFISFFLVLILLSLLLAMGRNTPVYPFIFKYVPGFGVFRAPARLLLFYTFGISTLAGIGAHHFRLTYRTQYVTRLTAAGAGAMLVISLTLGRVSEQVGLGFIKPTFAPAMARFALALGLSALLLLLRGREAGEADPRVARSPLPAGVWRGLVIGFIIVDLGLFAAFLTPTMPRSIYTALTNTDRFLMTRSDDDRLFATYDYDYDTKFNGYLTFSDWGPSDPAHWLAFRETLVPNLNIFTNTPSVNNDEPLVVGRWRELMDALRAADWPARLRLLRMLNVGYVLAESPPPGLPSVADVPNLYRVSDPLPRAWMVSQARLMPASHALLAELAAPDFDPTTEILLEAADYAPGQSGVRPTSPPLSNPVPEGHLLPVTISLQEEWNRRTIDIVASQSGYLVLAYTYYPGWRATIDGQPAEILRANYAFMTLPVGAGEHRVELCYRPLSFMLGAVISALSLLAAIGMATKFFGKFKRARCDGVPAVTRLQNRKLRQTQDCEDDCYPSYL